MAYGPLALKPSEFWAITPTELNDMVCGYEWREQRVWERFAWLAAHLINISGKTLPRGRRVRPKELLGKSNRHDPIAHYEKMQRLKEKLERRKVRNGDSR